MYCAQPQCHSRGRGKGICATHFLCHFMWKRSSASCHQAHLSEWKSKRKRERKKKECSICGVTSKQHKGGRRGSGSTLKFQVERLRGRTKGNLLTLDTSFIHTHSHTHSYSHAGWATALQQHPSGFCYILWLLICAKHIWCKLLFSTICSKPTLIFVVKCIAPSLAIPKPAFIWHNYSGLKSKFNVALNIWISRQIFVLIYYSNS